MEGLIESNPLAKFLFDEWIWINWMHDTINIFSTKNINTKYWHYLRENIKYKYILHSKIINIFKYIN